MASAIDLAVDTSALTAILLGEPDAAALISPLMAAPEQPLALGGQHRNPVSRGC